MGMTLHVIDIPAYVLDEAIMLRDQLLEAVAVFNDTSMQMYFEDPESLAEI